MNISPVDDRTIRLTGTSSFDIRDFGMQPPKVLLLKVEPEVQVRVEIVRGQGRVGGADGMCLGIPGQLKEISEVNGHLARVDVSGVTRVVNIGLLEDEPLRARGLGVDPRGLRHVEDRRGRSRSWPWPRCSSWAGLRRRAGRILGVEDLE